MLGLLLVAAFSPQTADAVPTAAPAQKPNSVVIFMYQRIGEDSVSDGNTSLEQFQSHVEELKAGGYHVLPLSDAVAAMAPGAPPLPEKSVAITFDGAYMATIATARKILDAADFPFTIFFSGDQADGGSPDHMTWSQLKSLKKDKRVTLGILPAAYAHMTDAGTDGPALINRAVSKYRENFGEDAQFFAWPYGEYSAALKKQVAGYHFKAVFGQQSGVVWPGADMLSLPRFTMTDEYADLDRFRLTASALPLPVSDVVPDDIVVADARKPPLVGFTVAPEVKSLSRLSCFVSDLGKAPIVRPGGGRVEIRLKDPLQDRRTRINCTLPDGQNWRWFGMLLLAPGIASEDASAPDDSADTDADTE
jgi:hypothetical protein